MVYGAFAALAQKDFKRLVAYSSVSHMGYVVLGFGVWSARRRDTNYNPDYWKMGVNGAMFQMIAHGISSAGMFFMVGVIYDRVHHRNLNEFGGLFAKMPVYSGLSIGIFFAGLGLPGLVRVHRRSAGRPLRLEIQHRPGGHCGLGRDPDSRLHPVGHPAGLPRAGIQGPARRGDHADHDARIVDRRAAVVLRHLVRCLSAGGLQLHDAVGRSHTVDDLAEWTENVTSWRKVAGEEREDGAAESAGGMTASEDGLTISARGRWQTLGPATRHYDAYRLTRRPRELADQGPHPSAPEDGGGTRSSS